MRRWPPFDVWYSDMLRIAYSWRLSGNEVESIPLDWYVWCWRKQWHPGDALHAAMVGVGLMNPNGYFDV